MQNNSDVEMLDKYASGKLLLRKVSYILSSESLQDIINGLNCMFGGIMIILLSLALSIWSKCNAVRTLSLLSDICMRT